MAKKLKKIKRAAVRRRPNRTRPTPATEYFDRRDSADDAVPPRELPVSLEKTIRDRQEELATSVNREYYYELGHKYGFVLVGAVVILVMVTYFMFARH